MNEPTRHYNDRQVVIEALDLLLDEGDLDDGKRRFMMGLQQRLKLGRTVLLDVQQGIDLSSLPPWVHTCITRGQIPMR